MEKLTKMYLKNPENKVMEAAAVNKDSSSSKRRSAVLVIEHNQVIKFSQ